LLHGEYNGLILYKPSYSHVLGTGLISVFHIGCSYTAGGGGDCGSSPCFSCTSLIVAVAPGTISEIKSSPPDVRESLMFDARLFDEAMFLASLFTILNAVFIVARELDCCNNRLDVEHFSDAVHCTSAFCNPSLSIIPLQNPFSISARSLPTIVSHGLLFGKLMMKLAVMLGDMISMIA